MNTFSLIGTLAGGLGLFLIAIGMMTDGLKLAAGASLRKLLAKWTKTPKHGIFTGFLMTAIVQSSSAVTVASIGFVNAGLLSMHRALGIIYGSNVGTTMTGWLVALVGFKFDIQALALPLIGLGALLTLLKKQSRMGALGMALVGFGLFFVGLDLLKNAFEGVVSTFDISQFHADGLAGIVTFLLVGIVMTVLTQSSSASIAITITAASSGILGLYAAGAMVIGANIGTTSTAVLAAIGATSNAKRVAAAQVCFNFLTAFVALLLLPVLFYLINQLTAFFGRTTEPALALALFHTLFNLLGVILIFPLNNKLANYLKTRFQTWEEAQSHPRFLDKTVAQTPSLAVNALILELDAIGDRLIGLFQGSIAYHDRQSQQIDQQIGVILALCDQVSAFIVSVEQSALSEQDTEQLAQLMRVEQYLLTCCQELKILNQLLSHRYGTAQDAVEQQFQQYEQQALAFIKSARTDFTDEAPLNNLLEQHDALKAQVILQGTRAALSVDKMSVWIESLSQIKQFYKHWYKAYLRLGPLKQQINADAQSTD